MNEDYEHKFKLLTFALVNLVQYAKPVDRGYFDSVRIDNQLTNSHQLIWTDRLIYYDLFFNQLFTPESNF